MPGVLNSARCSRCACPSVSVFYWIISICPPIGGQIAQNKYTCFNSPLLKPRALKDPECNRQIHHSLSIRTEPVIILTVLLLFFNHHHYRSIVCFPPPPPLLVGIFQKRLLAPFILPPFIKHKRNRLNHYL